MADAGVSSASAAAIEKLLAPPTPVAALAREVTKEWATPAVFNHSVRAWVWARTLGDSLGLAYDAELLYVASLLHDLGVAEAFDAHVMPFERAGGAVGWTFAAGAGWDAGRRQRVADVIERHMWVEVDPAMDVEGHLLEVSTSLDVAGVGMDRWPTELLLDVTNAVPRLDFSPRFAESIHAQAVRKPGSNAERLDNAGRVRNGGVAWDALLAGSNGA